VIARLHMTTPLRAYLLRFTLVFVNRAPGISRSPRDLGCYRCKPSQAAAAFEIASKSVGAECAFPSRSATVYFTSFFVFWGGNSIFCMAYPFLARGIFCLGREFADCLPPDGLVKFFTTIVAKNDREPPG
jgi:hypothetical protein